MSSSTIALNTLTQNTDRRSVLSDSVSVGDGSNSTINTTSYNYSLDAEVMSTLAGNMPDAIRAISQAGATVIRDAGGAVVDLQRDSLKANSRAWDSTVMTGAQIVDKAIDAMSQGYSFATRNATDGYLNQRDNVSQGYSFATRNTSDAYMGARENVSKSYDFAAANVAAANKQIEAGYGLASEAIKSFMPTDNKSVDSMKYAVIAVAAVVALVFLNKK